MPSSSSCFFCLLVARCSRLSILARPSMASFTPSSCSLSFGSPWPASSVPFMRPNTSLRLAMFRFLSLVGCRRLRPDRRRLRAGDGAPESRVELKVELSPCCVSKDAALALRGAMAMMGVVDLRRVVQVLFVVSTAGCSDRVMCTRPPVRELCRCDVALIIGSPDWMLLAMFINLGTASGEAGCQ